MCLYSHGPGGGGPIQNERKTKMYLPTGCGVCIYGQTDNGITWECGMESDDMSSTDITMKMTEKPFDFVPEWCPLRKSQEEGNVAKDIEQYTLEELQAMENFGKNVPFNSVVLVPMEDMHDSGYRCMKFILLHDHKIVRVVSGWSDVIHLNGIGGYGRNLEKAFSYDRPMVGVMPWSIDCLPTSGCMRLLTRKNCVTDSFIGSDFIIYAKEEED